MNLNDMRRNRGILFQTIEKQLQCPAKDKRQGRNLGPYPSTRSLLCAFDELQLELFQTLLHKSLTLPRAPWTLQLASSGALSSSKTFTEGEAGDFRTQRKTWELSFRNLFRQAATLSACSFHKRNSTSASATVKPGV